VEFIIHFRVKIHRSLTDTFSSRWGVLGIVKPANGITSFPILARPR
jgi:hypothetical protein